MKMMYSLFFFVLNCVTLVFVNAKKYSLETAFKWYIIYLFLESIAKKMRLILPMSLS